MAGLYTLTPKKYRCAFISVAESISSNCLHIRYQESGQDRNMLGAVWENEVLIKDDNLIVKIGDKMHMAGKIRFSRIGQYPKDMVLFSGGVSVKQALWGTKSNSHLGFFSHHQVCAPN